MTDAKGPTRSSTTLSAHDCRASLSTVMALCMWGVVGVHVQIAFQRARQASAERHMRPGWQRLA